MKEPKQKQPGKTELREKRPLFRRPPPPPQPQPRTPDTEETESGPENEAVKASKNTVLQSAVYTRGASGRVTKAAIEEFKKQQEKKISSSVQEPETGSVSVRSAQPNFRGEMPAPSPETDAHALPKEKKPATVKTAREVPNDAPAEKAPKQRSKKKRAESSGAMAPRNIRTLFRTYLRSDYSTEKKESGHKKRRKIPFILLFAALLAVIVCGSLLFFSVTGSSFGIFFSDEATGTQDLSKAVDSIGSAYESEIERTIASYESDPQYKSVRVVYRGDAEGDSFRVNNWNDVLAVYSVYATTRAENATDVITVTPESIRLLKEVFYRMNSVSYEPDVQIVRIREETMDEDGNTWITLKEEKELTLYVELNALSAEEGGKSFSFDDRQTELLSEMCLPEYDAYYARLAGIDLYEGADLTELVSHLPSSSKGAEVVKAALTKLGAPYVMGAKGPRRFDCSGLAYWSVAQVDPALGRILYTNAAGQARYCYNHHLTVSREELEPGDLVFWQNLRCSGCSRWNEVHHVGIYMGDGKVIEASSSKGRVVIRKLWSSKNYPLFMFGRPYSD